MPYNSNKPSKFCRFQEFGLPKKITPLKVVKLCGTDTNSKYRDPQGCVYHMEFVDHDLGDMIRTYETPYDSFVRDMKNTVPKVDTQHSYTLQCAKDSQNHWKWVWTLIS